MQQPGTAFEYLQFAVAQERNLAEGLAREMIALATIEWNSLRLLEGLRAQRFGVRPRIWSKPCLMAAKRASIIGSNSRSVKI